MPVLNKQNANRFRKVYPGIRKTPIYGAGKNIEGGVLTLTNQNSGTYEFANSYKKIPAVTASILNFSGEANTNVFITSISKTSVTFETSVSITGKIHLQVVEVL